MNPILQFALFASVSMLVFSLFVLYLGKRLISPLRLSPWRRRVAWAALLLLAWAGPLSMGLGRTLSAGSFVDTAQAVGFVLMAVGAVLFTVAVARDLLWFVYRGVESLSSHFSNNDATSNPERRQFLFNMSSAGVMLTATASAGVGIFQARQSPRIRRLDVPVQGLPEGLDGLRIAQLSDIHVGPTISAADLEEMVELTMAERPEMIAITGDLVDGLVEDLRQDVSALSRLQASLGVFYVTGNHEYYWNGEAWAKEVERLGLQVLLNRHTVIERGGAQMVVAGVADVQAERFVPAHRSDPEAALANAPNDAFTLLLAHQPKSVQPAWEAGADLVLAGHTHGGQFFPISLLSTPIHRYSHGLYEEGGRLVHVSAGAGYWGPPLRLGVPRELNLLTLRRV